MDGSRNGERPLIALEPKRALSFINSHQPYQALTVNPDYDIVLTQHSHEDLSSEEDNGGGATPDRKMLNPLGSPGGVGGRSSGLAVL